MQSFFLNRDYFGWLLPHNGTYVDRPILWGRLDVRSDLAYYYVCLAGLALAVAAARSLRSHRSGRVLIAARDNGRAAQAYGVNLSRTRLAAFAISGFIAAMAGAEFAYLQGGVDPAVFPPLRSIQLFAMTVIGGLTSVPGAIAGAAYVVAFQYFFPDYQLLGTGAGLLLLLLAFPGGLSEVGFRARDQVLRGIAQRLHLHVPSLVADDQRADAGGAEAAS
jgi:branched-chain amino acid transport system permease protein